MTEARKLHSACLDAAAASRELWIGMMRTGHYYTWDHYRAWLEDARAARMGQPFGNRSNTCDLTPYKRA